MATVSTDTRSIIERERAFFFAMAIAIAVTAVIGFGFFIVMGISSFGAPWFVHVHAVTMMGWLVLYLAQNGLVARDNVVLHRKLGILAAAWSVWLVPIGLATTVSCIAGHRAPPFFQDPAFFLAMDWSTILLFAGLTWTALGLRNRPDWHKRLMLGANVNLIGPAWGRLVPLPLTGQDGVLMNLAVLLVYLGVAMAFDRRLNGRVHPAHVWSAGLLVSSFAVVWPLSAWHPFRATVTALTGA